MSENLIKSENNSQKNNLNSNQNSVQNSVQNSRENQNQKNVGKKRKIGPNSGPPGNADNSNRHMDNNMRGGPPGGQSWTRLTGAPAWDLQPNESAQNQTFTGKCCPQSMYSRD